MYPHAVPLTSFVQQYTYGNGTGGTVSALLSDEDAADEGRMGGRTFVGGRTLLNVRTAASMTFADKTGPGPGPRAKTTVDAAVLGGEDTLLLITPFTAVVSSSPFVILFCNHHFVSTTISL